LLLVTYDLNRPGQEYQDLFEAIKAIGPWWHYLDSTWLLDTNLTANQAYKRLEPHVDKNDHVLIIKVDPYDKQGWLPKKAWDWINGHKAA
jgi:hypothetical protein